MSRRRSMLVLACMAALVAAALPSMPALASRPSAHQAASREQVARVRRAAMRFVSAELTGDGAEACAVLEASMRANVRGRTCEQRWDARLRSELRDAGVRTRLRKQKREIPTAAVDVRGYRASIRLAAPLLDGSSNFVWTENCWMLVA